MTNRSAALAACASLLIPGLGQLYNGERAKGLAVLCMDIGIGLGIALALWGPPRLRSAFTAILLGFIYLFVWIPAIIDAHQHASGAARPLLSGEKVWYVILMLLTIGPGALPLLWQSRRFSRIAKILWSSMVVLIFLGGILLILYVVPALEGYYEALFEAMRPMQ